MAAPSMAVCTSRVVGALLLLVGMAVPVLGAAGSNAGKVQRRNEVEASGREKSGWHCGDLPSPAC